MHRSTRNTRLLAGLLLSIVVALVLPAVQYARAKEPPRKAAGFSPPRRSDAGAWEGSWFYKTHKEKWALWMRVENGIPELKIQFQNYDQGENFITDWLTVSHYASKGKKGLFKPIVHHRDADLIQGDWFWELGTPEVDPSVRTETATFEIYRTGRGRHLVLVLRQFERVYEGKRVYRMAADQAWTFQQASRRHARWEELPF